ncbi:hypothetical protein [Evansella tamaricis]|uniref:Uncharacterized protein n=1 Tax=Evansella tamaricis TaxID=2069301 RepID=A0ABS6JFE3_9BACI|nr:hypothetical protein [Evansella tamaricis]MBU9712356.1 hypothetical protein [Evansella tamaricis]
MEKMKKMKKTRLYVGIGLAIFGLAGITADFEAFAEEGFSRFASFLFLTLPVIGLGVYLIQSYFKKSNKIKNEFIERTTLQLVTKLNGKITVTDLAANSEMSITEAEKVLEDFSYRGIASRKLTERGATVYHFKTVMTTEEKESAKDIYEF